MFADAGISPKDDEWIKYYVCFCSLEFCPSEGLTDGKNREEIVEDKQPQFLVTQFPNVGHPAGKCINCLQLQLQKGTELGQ
jgi:hypothetical protein